MFSAKFGRGPETLNDCALPGAANAQARTRAAASTARLRPHVIRHAQYPHGFRTKDRFMKRFVKAVQFSPPCKIDTRIVKRACIAIIDRSERRSQLFGGNRAPRPGLQ